MEYLAIYVNKQTGSKVTVKEIVQTNSGCRVHYEYKGKSRFKAKNQFKKFHKHMKGLII